MRWLRRLLVVLLSAWGLYRVRRWLYAWGFGLPRVRTGVQVTRDIPIAMPDGAVLLCDHYEPTQHGDYPTLLMRSPYGRGRDNAPLSLGLSFLAERFAERGYHVIAQTTRGRFDSGGDFVPYIHEKTDGLATIEWIKTQPWFNGRIGLWGPSYLGVTQWAIIADAPPEVQAFFPFITGSRVSSLQFPDGAFALETSLRWTTATDDVAPDAQRDFERALMHLPLKEADQIAVGRSVAAYQLWLLTEGDPDHAYWRRADHHAEVVRVQAAAHLLTGWYDIWLRELLADFAALKRTGRQPYLTIGPWPHISAGVLQAGLQHGLTWMDARLKGERAGLRVRPVAVYVMGAEEWRYMDDFPPPADETAFYLGAEGRLMRGRPAANEAPDTFTYDPGHPTPAIGGVTFNTSAGRVDNRELEKRPDVLVYTSDLLPEALEIMGYVRADLYVASSLTHTDFFCRLCDVGPDGVSKNVCDGLFRVTPETLQPESSGVWRVPLDLWATAYRFNRGHRLRVLVASGAHPRWARNLGTGEPFAEAITLKTAQQTVYHDAQRPSAVMLPVIGGA